MPVSQRVKNLMLDRTPLDTLVEAFRQGKIDDEQLAYAANSVGTAYATVDRNMMHWAQEAGRDRGAIHARFLEGFSEHGAALRDNLKGYGIPESLAAQLGELLRADFARSTGVERKAAAARG